MFILGYNKAIPYGCVALLFTGHNPIIKVVILLLVKRLFRRKVLNDEPKYMLKVGHDRHGNLIIKELKVSGDNLEEVIAQIKEGVSQFTEMAVEKVLGLE